jgi:hypothetical protein
MVCPATTLTKESPMAKKDNIEEFQELEIEQPEESPMAKPVVDPHAGLVKMTQGDKTIHAHPTVIKEHEKNGWKVA